MRLVVTRVVPALLVIVITAGRIFLQFKDKDFRLRKGNCLQLGRNIWTRDVLDIFEEETGIQVVYEEYETK